MMHKPHLIPYLSGVHSTFKKTCLIFDEFDHAHVLESVYRPDIMLCIGDNRKFGSDLHHVDQMIWIDGDMKENIERLKEQFNIIVHTDREELLDYLCDRIDEFGFRKDNVALSTGLLRETNLRELGTYAKLKIDTKHYHTHI